MEGMRRAFLGSAGWEEAMPSLGALGVFAAVLLPAGLPALRAATRKAREEGSLGPPLGGGVVTLDLRPDGAKLEASARSPFLADDSCLRTRAWRRGMRAAVQGDGPPRHRPRTIPGIPDSGSTEARPPRS